MPLSNILFWLLLIVAMFFGGAKSIEPLNQTSFPNVNESASLVPEDADQLQQAVTDSQNCEILQDGIPYYVDATSDSVLVINSQARAEQENNLAAYQAVQNMVRDTAGPENLDFQALRSFCSGEDILAYFELADVSSQDGMTASRTFIGFHPLQSVPLSQDDIQATIVFYAERDESVIKMREEIPISSWLTSDVFESCARSIEDQSAYLSCFSTALQSSNEAQRGLRVAVTALMDRFTLTDR